jgi:crotonobetainyl-CoA:carnitine CoA-transferase CaiB-like acyl-CoA transferase
VKVEPPGGDPGRASRRAIAAPTGASTGSSGTRRTPASAADLDLAHPAARDVLARLGERVDFVIESFPPDSAAARLVAEVAAARPALVTRA